MNEGEGVHRGRVSKARVTSNDIFMRRHKESTTHNFIYIYPVCVHYVVYMDFVSLRSALLPVLLLLSMYNSENSTGTLPDVAA